MTGTRTIAGWGSSSMELIGPALDVVLAEHGVRFAAEGRGGETSHHTAARLGSLPVPVRTADGLIPASGTVGLEPTELDQVGHFLKPFAGHVAGVGGVVHGTEDGLWLTRTRPGAPVPVAGDPFVPVRGTALRGHDTLLWMGKNDLNRGAPAAEVIERTVRSARWLQAAGARVAVIGQFVNNDADPALRREVRRVDAACAEHFGPAHLDVQELLTDPALPRRTDQDPSPQDLAARADGAKPPSLSNDPGHLNQHGDQVVAVRILEHLVALGWL